MCGGNYLFGLLNSKLVSVWAMIKSSVTISLVPQAKGGPFVFWDLHTGCKKAAQLGFDAVEIFAPTPDAVDKAALAEILKRNNLELSALGTGAGYVLHKLSLTDSDEAGRREAIDFVKGFVALAGGFGAPAIIGSMQGVITEPAERAAVVHRLGEALKQLADCAARFDVPVLFEPLNRRETNCFNRLEEAGELIESLDCGNIKLLADLYHINIEEESVGDAIRENGEFIGYVHLVDSNRRAAGFGEIDFSEVAGALCDIGYDGFASAEALPWPDSEAAAGRTMETFRKYFVKDT